MASLSLLILSGTSAQMTVLVLSWLMTMMGIDINGSIVRVGLAAWRDSVP